MRALIGIGLLVAVLALIGWITFSVSSDHSSINVETQTIEEDLDKLSDSAERLGERMTADPADDDNTVDPVDDDDTVDPVDNDNTVTIDTNEESPRNERELNERE